MWRQWTGAHGQDTVRPRWSVQIGKFNRQARRKASRLSSDIKDAVWKDINRSGVELELRVASIMYKAGFAVIPHQVYVDYDEGKARELDIVGRDVFELDLPKYEFTFDLHLLTQCKKIPGNSWTFFIRRDKDGFSWSSPRLLAIGGFQQEVRMEPFDCDPFNLVLGKTKKVDSDSVLYREAILDPKKSNKQTDNLFEASISIAKAWEHRRREAVKSRQQALDEYVSELLPLKTADAVKLHLASGLIFDQLSVFQPLVVYEGSMFVASLEERHLEPANLVRLWVEYHSSKYEVSNLAVDVCHVNYMQEHLDMFSKARNEFKATVMNPRPPPYALPGEHYDHSKSWLENMHLRLMDKLAREVAAKNAKDGQAGAGMRPRG